MWRSTQLSSSLEIDLRSTAVWYVSIYWILVKCRSCSSASLCPPDSFTCFSCWSVRSRLIALSTLSLASCVDFSIWPKSMSWIYRKLIRWLYRHLGRAQIEKLRESRRRPMATFSIICDRAEVLRRTRIHPWSATHECRYGSAADKNKVQTHDEPKFNFLYIWWSVCVCGSTALYN